MNGRTFRWRRRVGMRDVDAFGVVWHGNYLAFCDEARAELLRSVGLSPSELVARGYKPVVASVEARFLAPARFDEMLEIDVGLVRPRGSKLPFLFEIRREGEATPLARLTTTLVLLDASNGLLYLIPEELRDAVRRLEAYVVGGSS